MNDNCRGEIMNDNCSCGGKIIIIYFTDTDGRRKPDYAICNECLRSFTISD